MIYYFISYPTFTPLNIQSVFNFIFIGKAYKEHKIASTSSSSIMYTLHLINTCTCMMSQKARLHFAPLKLH